MRNGDATSPLVIPTLYKYIDSLNCIFFCDIHYLMDKRDMT